jgi:hypothetical protein
MTWPPAGHDRQRELFDGDAEPCEPPRAEPDATDDEEVQTLVRALAADVEHGNVAALRQDVADLYEHLRSEHPAEADEWTPDGWTAGEAAAERADDSDDDSGPACRTFTGP